LLVGCLGTAFFRHILGAAESVGFWSVLGILPIVAMRLAHRAAPEVAFWLAGGVLVLGALWQLTARFVARRAPDALLAALLGFQIFFVLRFGGSLLPSAGTLSFTGLALAQKITFFLQTLLFVLLIVWSARPSERHDYTSSAPSRVTGFLKKRRLPARIGGALLIVIAFGTTVFSVCCTAESASTPLLLAPPLLFIVWLALDGLYVIGRTLWQRVH
jgi:hypothetical protein